MRILISENMVSAPIFYHGTPDKKNWGMGNVGVHVGTLRAASQALQARIGIPAQGTWDGTREYGKTLLAGRKTLEKKNIEFGYHCTTGYNCGMDLPDDDYYAPKRQERAKYSNGQEVPFSAKPNIFRLEIIGPMKNTMKKPIADLSANRKIVKDINNGTANGGYYYRNEAEDSGSISAVVPNKNFLRIV